MCRPFPCLDLGSIYQPFIVLHNELTDKLPRYFTFKIN
nr:MAG TPA: hypothetical protein [Caudoviricetes sp.]